MEDEGAMSVAVNAVVKHIDGIRLNNMHGDWSATA
jgi:hypothetical protein